MLKTAGVMIVVACVGLMVSTTSEFVGKRLPFISSERISSEQANRMNSDFITIDFEDSEEASRWYTVDDVVMGGVSQGSFAVTPAAV
ncbi:MAG: CIA30 family protein, partial [Cyanobacteria bacterium P01_D01_bin.1]